MKKNKVTLQTLANELGVSKVAISKALNGKPGVSEELRHNAIELAKQLGYAFTVSPLNQDEQLVTKRIVLLMNEQYFGKEDFFYPNLFSEIMKSINGNLQLDQELHLIDEAMILSGNLPFDAAETDGCFIIGQLPVPYVETVKQHVPATILVDFSIPTLQIDSVQTENYRSLYQLTSWLIEQNHRRLVFVTNSKETRSIRDRYFGFLSALYDFDLLPSLEQTKVNWEDDFEIDVNDLPDAYVCNNDRAAMVITNLLLKQDINVPEQVSVVGFDDTAYSTMLDPEITTMHVDLTAMAEAAVKLLEDRLQSPEKAPETRLLFPKLLVRQSHAQK